MAPLYRAHVESAKFAAAMVVSARAYVMTFSKIGLLSPKHFHASGLSAARLSRRHNIVDEQVYPGRCLQIRSTPHSVLHQCESIRREVSLRFNAE